MSHPDPLFDSDNTLEDDMVYNDDEQFYMEREFTGNFDRTTMITTISTATIPTRMVTAITIPTTTITTITWTAITTVP